MNKTRKKALLRRSWRGEAAVHSRQNGVLWRSERKKRRYLHTQYRHPRADLGVETGILSSGVLTK